jgi:hypothetical protein
VKPYLYIPWPMLVSFNQPTKYFIPWNVFRVLSSEL